MAIWAKTTTTKRLPPLQEYLVAVAAEAEPETAKTDRLRAAMQVLSAQYGLPLRERTK